MEMASVRRGQFSTGAWRAGSRKGAGSIPVAREGMKAGGQRWLRTSAAQGGHQLCLSSNVAYKPWKGRSDYVETVIPACPKVILQGAESEVFGQHFASFGSRAALQWSFLGGSRIVVQSETQRVQSSRKSFRPCAFWLQSSQIASSAFTLGTLAVLPFYTLMVLAPKARLTRRSMESTIPYIVLGILYAYLLYLSWTPDTIRLMFASKYWLPELPGIAKMFSNEMTLASAWVHLLVVDLFAARQIFHDGLKNKIETRHSVSFCLLFCPIGILAHAITKALTIQKDSREVIQSHDEQA